MALHVRHRGHNRSACFFEPGDYTLYLGLLEKAARENECAVHAYCLMPNHVHLLATPTTETGLALTMKSVAQLYTQHVNKSYERTGSLWEGRFRSCLVPTDSYLLACYRYIEMNPVAAGMVENPRSHPWSSHRANAWGVHDSLITPHPACPGPPAYRGLFETAPDPDVIEDIRSATRGGYVVGAVRRGPGRPTEQDARRKLGTVPNFQGAR